MKSFLFYLLLSALWFSQAKLLAAAPANDNFADRLAVSTGTAIAATTQDATFEPGEPAAPLASGSPHSIWFTWAAPATGWYSMQWNAPGWDNVMAVWTGSALGSLGNVHVRYRNNSPEDVHCLIHAEAGTVYQISTGPAGTEGGPGLLLIQSASPPACEITALSLSSAVADVTEAEVTVMAYFSVRTTGAVYPLPPGVYLPPSVPGAHLRLSDGINPDQVYKVNEEHRVSGTGIQGDYSLPLRLPRYLSPATVWISLVSPFGDGAGVGEIAPLPSGAPRSLVITNAGVVDTTPPVITDVTFSASAVDLNQGPQSISVNMRAGDTVSGVKGATIELVAGYLSPQGISEGPRIAVSSLQRQSGTSTEGVYTGTLTVDFETVEPWTGDNWFLSLRVAAVDSAGNVSGGFSLAGQPWLVTGTALEVTLSYQAWAAAHFPPVQAADPVLTAMDADPDHDSFVNLVEYALHTDPLDASDRPSAPGVFDGRLGLNRFPFRGRHDVTVKVEAASLLSGPWQPLAVSLRGAAFAGASVDGTSIRDSVTIAEAASRFLRIRVEP